MKPMATSDKEIIYANFKLNKKIPQFSIRTTVSKYLVLDLNLDKYNT